jgi:hypothetical protein
MRTLVKGKTDNQKGRQNMVQGQKAGSFWYQRCLAQGLHGTENRTVLEAFCITTALEDDKANFSFLWVPWTSWTLQNSCNSLSCINQQLPTFHVLYFRWNVCQCYCPTLVTLLFCSLTMYKVPGSTLWIRGATMVFIESHHACHVYICKANQYMFASM